jgi:hypothetical protein
MVLIRNCLDELVCPGLGRAARCTTASTPAYPWSIVVNASMTAPMSSRSISTSRYAPPSPVLPSSAVPGGRTLSRLITSQLPPSGEARWATVARPSLPEPPVTMTRCCFVRFGSSPSGWVALKAALLDDAMVTNDALQLCGPIGYFWWKFGEGSQDRRRAGPAS